VTLNERKELACGIATVMGTAFDQEYRHQDGRWWLYTMGRAVRPLTADEIAWHSARRHAPFVPDGVEKHDPRWWDEPSD
jgi:hypothetical protein